MINMRSVLKTLIIAIAVMIGIALGIEYLGGIIEVLFSAHWHRCASIISKPGSTIISSYKSCIQFTIRLPGHNAPAAFSKPLSIFFIKKAFRYIRDEDRKMECRNREHIARLRRAKEALAT